MNSVGIGTTNATAKLDVAGTIKTEQLNISGVSTFTGSIHLPDSSGTDVGSIFLGDNDDLQIRHNIPTRSFNSTGALIIVDESKVKIRTNEFIVKSGDDSENLIRADNNGEVNLYYDGSKKFETTGYGVTVFGTTQTQQLNVTGVSTFQGNINLGDNDQIIIGDGPDLKLYHDGSHVYIQDSGVGNLKVLTNRRLVKNSFDNEFLLKSLLKMDL